MVPKLVPSFRPPRIGGAKMAPNLGATTGPQFGLKIVPNLGPKLCSNCAPELAPVWDWEHPRLDRNLRRLSCSLAKSFASQSNFQRRSLTTTLSYDQAKVPSSVLAASRPTSVLALS